MYRRLNYSCRRSGKTLRLIALAVLAIMLLSMAMCFSNKLAIDKNLPEKDLVIRLNGKVSRTKLSTDSLMKLTAERAQSTLTTKHQISSTKLPAHSLVELAIEKAESNKTATIHKPPTACLDKETIKSPKINKLGTYPQDRRFLTIGISSITRPSGKNYLLNTVRLLMDSLSEKDRKEVFIVIFLADFDKTHKYNSLTSLASKFRKYIDQDLLHVIFSPQDYYPPLSNMKAKFGDSQERIFWRSKLVVDFTYIMCYCKDLSQYYLHLEDDLIPSPSFYPKLQDFITSQKNPWAMLDAAFMGHTAKVYHSSDLENVAAYFYLLYDEMPVDWLIIFWRKIKYHDNFVLPPASLFQHVGSNSSFVENKLSYKSKEIYFDEYDIKYRGLNPVAIVSSSMDAVLGTKPEHAYNKGAGYFWAKGVEKDKDIVLKFTPATAVREVFVGTGSHLGPKDQLKSGVLQASFQTQSSRAEESDAEVCNYKDFETIGNFKNGRVKVALNGQRKVSCLRILVTENQQEWLFLREVDVWRS